MPGQDHYLHQAAEAETLARLVSYGPDRERLLQEARRYRLLATPANRGATATAATKGRQ